jgi:multidrug resistance efflux pump
MNDSASTPPPAAPASSASGPAVPPTPAPVAPAAPLTPPQPDRRYRWLSSLAFAAVALIGVLIVLYAWRLPPFGSPVVSTENALVRGQVTIIGTQLSGYVVGVKVQDFQVVKKGDLLVEIDERTFRQRYEQAEAQLASVKATLANWRQQRLSAQASIALGQAGLTNTEAQALKAAADLQRVEQLVADGSLSIRERDASRAAKAAAVAAVAQARANLEISRQNLETVVVNRQGQEAAVANAEAALKAAKIDLDNTRIVAPSDGQLGQVTVRQGAYVNSGAQLMGLVPEQMWVIANFKETQMNGVRIGQGATFTVDAFDDAVLTGQVERISPATGSEFSVLPADNATGNYVKIAQRIPVRIRIDPGQQLAQRLRPGMSVVVSIDTSAVLDDSGRRPAPKVAR